MKRKFLIIIYILIFVISFTTFSYALSINDNSLTGYINLTINSVKPGIGLNVGDPIINIEKEGYHLSIVNKYWCNSKDERLSSTDTFTNDSYYLVFKVKLESSDYTFSNDISVISKGDMSGVSFTLVDIENSDSSSIATFKSASFDLTNSIIEESKEDKDEENDKKEETKKVRIEYKVTTKTILILLLISILILVGLVYLLRIVNLRERRNRGRK